jgi:hypothetical protein
MFYSRSIESAICTYCMYFVSSWRVALELILSLDFRENPYRKLIVESVTDYLIRGNAKEEPVFTAIPDIDVDTSYTLHLTRAYKRVMTANVSSDNHSVTKGA